MEAILDLLTPEQVDIIFSAYDSLALWYDQASTLLTDTINSIVIEDVML